MQYGPTHYACSCALIIADIVQCVCGHRSRAHSCPFRVLWLPIEKDINYVLSIIKGAIFTIIYYKHNRCHLVSWPMLMSITGPFNGRSNRSIYSTYVRDLRCSVFATAWAHTWKVSLVDPEKQTNLWGQTNKGVST